MSSVARRRVLIAVSVCVWTWVAATAGAAADVGRGIDPNQGLSLVEVDLKSKAAAMRLQLKAERYGVEFNEHYLRRNSGRDGHGDGVRDQARLRQAQRAGYDLGPTIEGPVTWERRTAQIMEAGVPSGVRARPPAASRSGRPPTRTRS